MAQASPDRQVGSNGRMSSQLRKVGIIGYGPAGRGFHAPLVASTPGLEVAVVVTSDPERAARARAEHPAAEVVADAEGLWARAADLGLVVVATPNDSHVALARRSIEAGVAVVVDKPLAATAAEGRELVDLAARAGVALSVFHNRRWDGDFLTLRDLLAGGRLGRVHRYESRFERWRPERQADRWREDPERAGGLLYDLGIHLIDQALVLWGPARQVYAELDQRRAGSTVADDVFVALTHDGGVRSHLWAGALVASLGPRLRVLGDEAGWTTYGLDAQEALLAGGTRPGTPEWDASPGDADGILGVGDDTRAVSTRRGEYLVYYQQMAAALAGEGPVPVDPRDAVAALVVVEAALRSAREGAVVAPGWD
jgi:predicted dehydrogenase